MIFSFSRFFSLLFLVCTINANASPVEVMHWWTSNGELDALNELRNSVEKTNNTWEDAAIKGGGGNTALTVLRSRAVSGNPPAAALIKGNNIQEWASLGFLTSLDKIAQQEQWDAKLPAFIQPIMKYNGHYVAVPINIHRVNWLWLNKATFAKTNIKTPSNLDELIASMQQLKDAGILPIAHTSEPWADAVLFESITLSVLGPKLYQQAFVDLNPAVLASDAMKKAFDKLRTISLFIDNDAKGRSWDQATQMLIKNQAAMQIMGDWVLGELAPKQSNIQCQVFPGSTGSFSYNIDSFAFFKLKSVSEQTRKAQNDFARTILSPALQLSFNNKKGSLPITTDADTSKLGSCSQQAYQDYITAKNNNSLVPTFAQAMATTTYVQSAITTVISHFIYDKTVSTDEAITLLVNAIKVAQ